MSYLIENKKSSTIYNNLKFAFVCNGLPSEIGSDNGKEFRNELIENYLKSKNINYIHGMPYNPHYQGVVGRFHKTIKDGLYCRYNDNPGNFDIKQSLEFIIKNTIIIFIHQQSIPKMRFSIPKTKNCLRKFWEI